MIRLPSEPPSEFSLPIGDPKVRSYLSNYLRLSPVPKVTQKEVTLVGMASLSFSVHVCKLLNKPSVSRYSAQLIVPCCCSEHFILHRHHVGSCRLVFFRTIRDVISCFDPAELDIVGLRVPQPR